jgi:predicted outer membrane repeat protein
MGNDCHDDGGGVYFSGDSAEVYNSTFSTNHCNSLGAGYYQFEGKTIFEGTTFQDNESEDDGGGVRNFQGGMTLVNTTFSGNFAVREGGAIYAQAPISLLHCTLIDNEAWDHGGGIRMTGDTAFLSNTLIAKNLSADEADISTVGGGRFWSRGYNLIGDTSEVRLPPGPGDIMGNNNNPVDPQVLALADNTGPTLTIALDPASPAIDMGNSMITTDQRGVIRPQGMAVDIGAYEWEMNVGMEEIAGMDRFMVYPNPFSNNFHIVFSDLLNENTEAKLYDISGRQVGVWRIEKGLERVKLDVSQSVVSGIYFLEVCEGRMLMVRIKP